MARQGKRSRDEGIPSLMYLIKQVELAAKSHLDEIVSRHRITAHQYTTLAVLARNPGMTGARLARNAFVRVQSMASTVAALEARGLITREVDPESRRQLRITLTPAGWELVHAIQVPLDAFEQGLLEDFSDDEVQTLGRTLHRLRVHLGGSQPR